MRRLYVVVEGQSEQKFVRDVLGPHRQDRGLAVFATIVGTPKRRGSAPLQKGGGDWGRWRGDIARILRDQRGDGIRCTTLFDLYGLPKGFPGLAEHGSDTDTVRRRSRLEQALRREFEDHRFIPYLQRHEFEALVLASLSQLEVLLDSDDDLSGLSRLAEQVGDENPEDVNDGRATAPSKRLLSSIPGYRKVIHGPLAIGATGLRVIRERCPGFDAWVGCLEGLAP